MKTKRIHKKLISLPAICALLFCFAFLYSAGRTNKDAAAAASQQKDSVNHAAMQKAELEKIYSMAIADYIKLLKKQHKLKYAVLFFGKHQNGKPEDFPDITLPVKMGGTSISLIDPVKGEEMQKENKSSAYINLIGWVNDSNASFIFVTFTDGFVHQFDYFINYKFDIKKKKYLLDDNRFVNYHSTPK